MPNQRLIAEIGIDAFLEQQRQRITFLETSLEYYDDGRSKNFLCLAATLLSLESLKDALSLAAKGEDLKSTLIRLAGNEGQQLKLRK